MEESQPIPLIVEPQAYYLTGAGIRSDEEQFVLTLHSGNSVRNYALSPKHAKRLKLVLDQQIAEYEKQFSEIKTVLPEAPKGESHKTNRIGF